MEDLLKLLEFKKELKELITKYEVSIEGAHTGNGDMYLYFNGISYILSDELNIYQEKCGFFEDTWIMEDIRKDLFLSSFPKTNNYTHQQNKTLICTNDRDKAIAYMNGLNNIEKCTISKTDVSFVSDGIYYKWVKLINNSKGNRYDGLVLDLDLLTDENEEMINYVLLPMCIFCTKDTVKFI